MANAGRRSLSTRSLTVLVAVFALVAIAMIARLATAIMLGPELPRPVAALVTPVPPPSVVPSDSGLSGSQAAPESAAGDESGWVLPSTTRISSPLMAKPVVPDGETRPRWTATPLPTNTPVPSPTPNPTFVSSAYGLGNYMPEGIGRNERWIDVSLGEQKLVAYEGLLPVFETLVSTGTALHPTVTGQFRIWLRFTSQDMDGYRLGYNYYLKNVPYVQYFYEDYSLHGTFWHNNFGTPMSHGCVNLSTPDAKWLYNWAGYGTLVNIHP